MLGKIVAYIFLKPLRLLLECRKSETDNLWLSSHTTTTFKKKEQDEESTDHFHLKIVMYELVSNRTSQSISKNVSMRVQEHEDKSFS